MSLSLETLKEQLMSLEQEFEVAKANVHRCDGAIQVLKHIITGAEAPDKTPVEE